MCRWCDSSLGGFTGGNNLQRFSLFYCLTLVICWNSIHFTAHTPRRTQKTSRSSASFLRFRIHVCVLVVCTYMLANLCRCLHLKVGGWLHVCMPKCTFVCLSMCACAICRFFFPFCKSPCPTVACILRKNTVPFRLMHTSVWIQINVILLWQIV